MPVPSSAVKYVVCNSCLGENSMASLGDSSVLHRQVGTQLYDALFDLANTFPAAFAVCLASP